MSDTKKNWLDKTGVIHLWNTIKALLDTKVDKIEGLGLSSNDYTVEDKTKVSKIKPVQNTLTSTDTEAGLSAAQGKVLKDIVDTKADNINVQPITIPTTGWGTENGVSAYPNYIDIPLAGVSSKDAVVIDISPSSAYFAAQAQFTNTESMDGVVRIRAKNVPTAAIKGQWYVIHGGGSVYEGELHNYYDKASVDKLLAGKLGLHDTADNGVVASGSNYVRFGDGTQICWGHISFGQMNPISATFSKFVFAVPFSSADYAIMSLQTGDVGDTNFLAINLVDKTTTDASVSVYNSKEYATNAGVIHDCIAIGRWK